MTLILLIYILIAASIFALLEIQIEGKNGWAAELPTWRVKNPIPWIVRWPYLDGYHVWLWTLMALLFHLPYFFGFEFSFLNELLILESLLIFLFIEDFLWFVFNPHWGFRKYLTREIPWQPGRFFSLPKGFWISLVIVIVVEALRQFLLATSG